MVIEMDDSGLFQRAFSFYQQVTRFSVGQNRSRFHLGVHNGGDQFESACGLARNGGSRFSKGFRILSTGVAQALPMTDASGATFVSRYKFVVKRNDGATS